MLVFPLRKWASLMVQLVKTVSHSDMSNSTPSTIAYQAPLSMGFSRQEYWSGCHAFLQGIFPTQGLNPGLLYCRWILYCLSHQGSQQEKNSHIQCHPPKVDFSPETSQARMERHVTFKVLKGKNLQLRILHSARLLFRIEGEIKKF